MKKLAIVILMAVPLAAIADMAPMSRDEWERCRQFDTPSTSPAGYALASLVGVLLSVCILALERSGRGKPWHDLVAVTPRQFVLYTILILAACLYAEWVGRPFSTLMSKSKESYEEYLFYQHHCSRCGSPLSYNQGRYCPICHPRHDDLRSDAKPAEKFYQRPQRVYGPGDHN